MSDGQSNHYTSVIPYGIHVIHPFDSYTDVIEEITDYNNMLKPMQ